MARLLLGRLRLCHGQGQVERLKGRLRVLVLLVLLGQLGGSRGGRRRPSQLPEHGQTGRRVEQVQCVARADRLARRAAARGLALRQVLLLLLVVEIERGGGEFHHGCGVRGVCPLVASPVYGSVVVVPCVSVFVRK